MPTERQPAGHSNVYCEEAERMDERRVIVPITGGADVTTCRRLPPLVLRREEWEKVGQVAGWTAPPAGKLAEAMRELLDLPIYNAHDDETHEDYGGPHDHDSSCTVCVARAALAEYGARAPGRPGAEDRGAIALRLIDNIRAAWGATFADDEPVNGGDLTEFVGEWLELVREQLPAA